MRFYVSIVIYEGSVSVAHLVRTALKCFHELFKGLGEKGLLRLKDDDPISLHAIECLSDAFAKAQAGSGNDGALWCGNLWRIVLDLGVDE